MTASFSAESLTTIGVGVTAWLPVSTAWPARSECSTQVYGANGGSIIAFDPFYASISPTTAIPCLPTEFTASWTQAYSTTPVTTTFMGPTFVCPAAYTSVGELVVQSMQMRLCCPSNFRLATPITTLINPTGFFPSQCTSSFTSGQTIIYPSYDQNLNYPQTTQTFTALETVFAWHMNGFNVPKSSDPLLCSSGSTCSTSSLTSSTGIATATATETATATATGTGNSNSSSKSLSNGAYAGIGVGAAFLAVAMFTAAILLRRRWRRKREYNLAGTEGNPTREGGYSNGGFNSAGNHEMETPDIVRIFGRHEMDNLSGAKSHTLGVVHEMHADIEGSPRSRQELSAT